MQWRSTVYYHVSPSRGGSPAIAAAPDGQRVVSTVLISGYPTLLAQAMRDFLGSYVLVNNGNTNYISRTIPHGYPGLLNTSGQPYCWASSFQVLDNLCVTGNEELATFTDDPNIPEKLPSYVFSRVQITYTSTLYKHVEDDDEVMQLNADNFDEGSAPPPEHFVVAHEGTLKRYVSKFRRPFSRLATLPRALMKWVPLEGANPADPASAPVTEGVGVAEGGYEITYIHHLRPDDPRERLQAALSTVNSDTFDGHPPGTLLLRSADTKPEILPNGEVGYTVQFQCVYLPRRARHNPGVGTPRGHNWFLRFLKVTDGGQTIRTVDYRQQSADGTAGGSPPFESSRFADLFLPDDVQS